MEQGWRTGCVAVVYNAKTKSLSIKPKSLSIKPRQRAVSRARVLEGGFVASSGSVGDGSVLGQEEMFLRQRQKRTGPDEGQMSSPPGPNESRNILFCQLQVHATGCG